ncbi:MAG TPA: peptide chain release factor N(5)-glutamine methyltransferase [Cytophagales bacterium]|jgi:release factor glutamine methyltransferase|nr:peptide chain release factor N(5)-glutamine methyltransferase [Cytophagales bacterium]
MIPKLTNSKVVFELIKAQLQWNDANEIHAVALLLMEKLYRVSLTDILSGKEIPPMDFTSIIERLNQHEPIQYILGEADFFGRKFKVNPSVLIPRPETEILIREILKLNLLSPTILDIGTGSGCIAITLKLEIPKAHVSAIDVSQAALITANRNAQLLNADVYFIHGNILTDAFTEEVSIMVSNPPYVTEFEKKAMDSNVLHFEPHLALFVPDSNPLLFYRAIAEKSKTILKPNGKLFVEINEALGQDVKRLFEDHGLSEVTISKDLNGKDRVVTATR